MNQDQITLRSLRKEKGLSQAQAAEKIGVSRQTWAAWELRTRSINLRQLHKIRHSLNLEEPEVMSVVDWGAHTSIRKD
jgi:transcriptional regulator with XRE-family HTH domain